MNEGRPAKWFQGDYLIVVKVDSMEGHTLKWREVGKRTLANQDFFQGFAAQGSQVGNVARARHDERNQTIEPGERGKINQPLPIYLDTPLLVSSRKDFW